MTTYTRDASIEAAPLQEETILLEPIQNRFCVLNHTATFIWNQLGTPRTKEALASEICENFASVTMETALADAERTLELLRSLRLVVDETRESVGERVHKAEPPKSHATSASPAYEPPRITAMNENEVLSSFQVPVVASTWWV
jgi:hypothetical protein